jgi:hypothetical protein
MTSIDMPRAVTAPGTTLERWKLAIAIGGAVILAPMTAIVMLLVILSLLPVILLELPFLAARSYGPAAVARAPLPPQETLPGAQQALAAMSTT